MLSVKPVLNTASADDSADNSVARSTNAPVEIELKLLAPAGELEPLRTTPIIAQHTRNQGVIRRLEAVYYDTPDRTLFDHGMSLRVRRSGKSYVQTLKVARADRKAFVRQEWETPVDGIEPDLTRLPTSQIGAPLDTIATDALLPVFSTKVRRRVQQLDFRNASIEVAFDDGMIEAGGRQEPLSEVELELTRGDVSALYDLGVQLLDAAPLRVGTLSKPDRGYAMAFDIAPQATKAFPSPVTADHVVDDLIVHYFGACQRQLLANQAAAEDGRDPEGVHQLRVTLRRLRSGCAMFRKAVPSPALDTFTSDAKWLMLKLGPAREWDVFASSLGRLERACGPAIEFEALRQAIRPHRLNSYAALRSALADPRYNRFLLSLGHWIERRGWRTDTGAEAQAALSQPAITFAKQSLTRLHRRALKAGAHFRKLDPAARHDLRVSLKTLRYAAEFFLPLYAERAGAKRYLAQLSGLQESLGRDSDNMATGRLLKTIEANEPELVRAVGAVIGWYARDHTVVAKTLRRRWHRFKTRPVYWNNI